MGIAIHILKLNIVCVLFWGFIIHIAVGIGTKKLQSFPVLELQI